MSGDDWYTVLRRSAALLCLCFPPLSCGDDGPPTEPPPPQPAYEIDIRYVPGTDPPEQFREQMEDAADRWERVIVGDLPSMQITEPAPFECERVTVPPMDEEVDDLVVWVEVGPMDGQGGIGGWGAVCRTRANHLPAVSSILFDEADYSALRTAGCFAADDEPRRWQEPGRLDDGSGRRGAPRPLALGPFRIECGD